MDRLLQGNQLKDDDKFMTDYIRIAVELLVGFIALFTLTQLLGKTQITQITPFDFISALVLGELVGNGLYDNEIGVPKLLFAVLIWGSLIYLLEIITQKWGRTRAWMEGRPSIVIHKGNINRKELKKAKLDIDQLRHLLRSKGAFSLQEVEYAILETDGTVSVLKKHSYEIPINQDLNIAPRKITLSTPLITDGRILSDNLKEINLSEQWLLSELKKLGYHSPKDLIFAEWDEGKPLYVIPYLDNGSINN
ncbi:uncharacterized membrane protein YcaP (DUF421 family) [Bacillus tianshenii]|uniref:Uncharacterized membrane protein YcaP (DUF421 family) n=2 Tax=Sutcliffiella tianshenii TaxID=1463404 RepID=A0ABS2P508_9BACI|nr:uncharacterized membrane protein YcaP (DUF421 family) [Bacillus tianshenii]